MNRYTVIYWHDAYEHMFSSGYYSSFTQASLQRKIILNHHKSAKIVRLTKDGTMPPWTNGFTAKRSPMLA